MSSLRDRKGKHRNISDFKWWKKLSSLDDKGMFVDVTLCWGLYKSRNGFIFSGQVDSAWDVWQKVKKAFNEFKGVSTKEPLPSINIAEWQFPCVRVLLNVTVTASYDPVTG
ncbi:hypothetical protein V6N13_099952 [Hibiscus sabdariffa]|uniref:Uncharacterized protein n=1 Tax=Hibiscus sabdariffa TaxID=183260 RepID=A0ABR2NLC2_9ROSI